MAEETSLISRRDFLAAGAATGASLAATQSSVAAGPPEKPAAKPDKAFIAITFDLEMARNFPNWEDTEWDYIKGNLDDHAKKYSVEAARRVKKNGGRIHFFVVGRVFEQKSVEWLKEIVNEGHPVGNHTYDHVYVLATDRNAIQYRFQRAPWLIHGKTIEQVIRDNIVMTDRALLARLGIKPAGFRTPGGFANGLSDRPDIQKMFLELGFDWVSCKYPKHLYGEPGEKPTKKVLDSILEAQKAAQPFVYPTGLIDIPMSPVSDIVAFRTGRWKLQHFLDAVKLAVEWAIEHRATFDFLAHPSCLGVMDPEFRTIDLICKLVEQAGDRAAITDLAAMTRRAGRPG
jgi:peptidoglycan/xylan/chitin deacetylase (PgdA/CDA1 family)